MEGKQEYQVIEPDYDKAIGFLLKAYELGNADAGLALAGHSEDGRFGMRKGQERKYYECAAKNRSLDAQHMLGARELERGNIEDGFFFVRLAASSGCGKSLETYKKAHRLGLVSTQSLVRTVMEQKDAQNEMKNENRDIVGKGLEHQIYVIPPWHDLY